MYINIDRIGTDILKPNSKYNMAIIEEFVNVLPCDKLPAEYLLFLLKYDTGEVGSLNRYYYVHNGGILSYPIVLGTHKREIALNYFCSLPEVLSIIYHHDRMYGINGFHRNFNVIKVAISQHDFDGIYMSLDNDSFGKVYYMDLSKINFDNLNSLSDYEIAANFAELLKFLAYKK